MTATAPSPQLDQVLAAVYGFWAESTGGTAKLDALEALVRNARLSSAAIKGQVIPKIPHEASGPTGQRCRRLVKMLERVAQE